MPIWPQYQPSWNVSPSAILSALVTPDRSSGVANFAARDLRWGIAAPWSEPGSNPRPLINARSETLFTKPTFKHLAVEHRAVIPVNGFYEWERSGELRIPWYVQARDLPAMLFAAVFQPMEATPVQPRTKKAALTPQMGFAFDTEDTPPDARAAAEPAGVATATTYFGEFAVVTTESVGAMADIHHRTPVMLTPDTAARWLLGEDQAQLQHMMQPEEAAPVTLTRVSTAVNSTRNDGPECVSAAAAD